MTGPIGRTPAGQASQIELILTAEPGKRAVGVPVRHFKCARCQIIYSFVAPPTATRLDPKCPLCVADIKTEQFRQATTNLTSKVDLLERQIRDLDSQVNLQSAMRSAADLLDAEDRTFLKSALYTWRQDRSVSLKVIHAEGKPNGFIADYRHGEPEARTCTSIGGSALAAYYEEALHTVGSAQAMQILLRAVQHLLPGATG